MSENISNNDKNNTSKTKNIAPIVISATIGAIATAGIGFAIGSSYRHPQPPLNNMPQAGGIHQSPNRPPQNNGDQEPENNNKIDQLPPKPMQKKDENNHDNKKQEMEHSKPDHDKQDNKPKHQNETREDGRPFRSNEQQR